MVKFCFCALCKYKIMFSRSIISTRLSALVAVQKCWLHYVNAWINQCCKAIPFLSYTMLVTCKLKYIYVMTLCRAFAFAWPFREVFTLFPILLFLLVDIISFSVISPPEPLDQQRGTRPMNHFGAVQCISHWATYVLYRKHYVYHTKTTPNNLAAVRTALFIFERRKRNKLVL